MPLPVPWCVYGFDPPMAAWEVVVKVVHACLQLGNGFSAEVSRFLLNSLTYLAQHMTRLPAQ